MNRLVEAAKELSSHIEGRGWSYCLIGGLAVQIWGEPRTTLDVDITLLAPWGEEAPVVDALLDRFKPRFPDARDFALRHRVLLVNASNGTPIDIALGALPFEETMLSRAVEVEIVVGVRLRCCTAEDLFIMKAFAGRDRDWADARTIVARQQGLDTQYALTQLADLCALRDDSETPSRARRMLEGIA